MADIHIIDAHGVIKVRPAVAKFRAGSSVVFSNLTQHDVELVFPAGLVAPLPSFRIPPRDTGRTGELTVQINRDARGYYEYQVLGFAPAAVLVAVGESAPGMIIDP